MTTSASKSTIEKKVSDVENEMNANDGVPAGEAKADTKVDPKVDAHMDATVEAKAAVNVDAKQEAKADTKVEANADTKVEANADTKVEAKTDDKEKDKKDEKKHGFTWERTIEIVKVLATIWVALVGSLVTMQFNERQHELNRIEAIAKMLPHVASKSGDEEQPSDEKNEETVAITESTRSAQHGRGASEKIQVKAQNHVTETAQHHDNNRDMGRDGAIWAIFRTANNRVMLRDLASLFPDDIYRVVSSIAIAGQLDKDDDALVALQVSSEKLAAKYSNNPKNAELASRLYSQALRLKQRDPNDASPMHVIDLTNSGLISSEASEEQFKDLVCSINDLADLHLREAEQQSTSNAAHWEAKELYKRARQIGLPHKDVQTSIQVVRADLRLAEIYTREKVLSDAATYLREAHQIENQILKENTPDPLKAADAKGDGDGFADEGEVSAAIQLVQKRFDIIQKDFPSKGVPVD